ncbi:peptidoglycan-binding protein [Plantactinospora solaniradicis]|uniref:Peptidoglycan-binding protein n=1 Tax=Plantactinospora solaniradicis TaxID=1723736 RepID=A0ABW1KHP2_9ACTN
MNRPLRTALVIGTSVVVVGAMVAAAVGFGGRNPATSPNTADPSATTAPVTRTTLIRTQQVNGVLGYGAPVRLNALGHGTITWLPAPGATIIRGTPVYKADNRAVPLLYGSLPLYRLLRSGDTGDDVKEIEQNLAALGYTGYTVDKSYTSTTAAAVRRWQKDLGLVQTGVVDPAAVVLARAALRVTEVIAHLGDQAGGPLLTYAGTTRVVTIALDVALQSLVGPGLPATITLPDGSTVDGTLTTVGAVATPGEDDQPATIDVTVTVADQSKLGRLDQAPVVVRLVSSKRDNVLAVPIAALVVLPGGGYGVQVMTGSSTHDVAVQLGMFADGKVQITGDGIAEGTLVVVPS